jgi:hypothetical protein
MKPWESALDFFTGRTNVAARDTKLLHNLIITIIQDYIPDQKLAHTLCNDLVTLMQRCPPGGNLYSICIPKEKFEESCYFAKPFGLALHNQKYLRDGMDLMQSGVKSLGAPQIRVLAHKVKPEEGFHIVVNSTLSNLQQMKLEEEVDLCIQAALTGYRLNKKPNNVFK